MKRLTITLPGTKKLPRSLIRLVALVLLTILYTLTRQYAPVQSQTVTPTPTEAVHEASTSGGLTATHGGQMATVVTVVDGDTIKIEGGEIVRYIGMNTPETVAPGRPVECYGREASAKNKELVQGQVVELEKDVSERDIYGRLLRYVWVGDELINDTLVREGYAVVSTYPPDVKYVDRFVEAQQEAFTNSRGLWGASCAPPVLPTVTPVATFSATPEAYGTPFEIYPTP